MAIVTGELYKGFTFGGISSKSYGVYITQEAAYNAPDRDVEVVEIAGRNGAYILDKGRFKNITVSYKCGIALDDEQSFESAIRSFRNALSSKAGKYVRLEDDYNVNEFRQAAFLGGIEVDMADRRAGEFTVSFDAMPQRFLKSGETAVSVASGGTIANPTLYESHPLLMTKGYGNITIGTDVIDINNDPYGRLLLANAKSTREYIDLDAGNMALMDTGDAITVSEGTTWRLMLIASAAPSTMGIASVTASVSGTLSGSVNTFAQGGIGYIDITLGDVGFVKGTTKSLTMTLEIGWTNNQGTTYNATAKYGCQFRANTRIRFLEISRSGVESPYQLGYVGGHMFKVADIYGDSTKTPLDETVYIDTDIGEAYTEAGGVVSSANALVSLPAKLPTLKSGENTITYDNTITQVRIVPRWWEV